MTPTFATGVRTISDTLAKHKTLTKAATAKALYKIGELVLDRAKYYVPVDTGLLKSTGVVIVYRSGNSSSVSVSFGKTDDAADGSQPAGNQTAAYYALWVHENLAVYHAPPTSAKFLEKAERESRQDMGKILLTELNFDTEFFKNGTQVP